MFDLLWKYEMRLNPNKLAFDVELGKFIGFIVNCHGIETNSEKIKVLVEIKFPRKVKDV